MAQTFNEDVDVKGTLTATVISGELSDGVRSQIDDIIEPIAVGVDDAVGRLAYQADKLDTRLLAAEAELEAVKAQNKALADSYNNAIKVINNLSERIAALESNYDPTVIK